MAIITTNKSSQAGQRIRRGLHRFAIGLIVLFSLIIGLALVGAGYEAIASGGDAQTYTPPGQLVDIGGYRLHIHCVGTGSPTVVLDAGLGGTSLDWSLVQDEMGKTTRVCAYDRAGMGWSDTGPQPRTPAQVARELHTLLTRANIEGPYVLVGHSLGGKNIRMFTLLYPAQVAGMVLVDARGEYVDAHTSPSEAKSFQQALAAKGTLLGITRRFGLIRLLGAGQFGVTKMSDFTRTEMALLNTEQKSVQAEANEGLWRAENDAQLQAAPSLGDRPLIVLAASQSMTDTPNWVEAQRLQAALSTKGRLIVVEGSGHSIHWDQPAVVVDAVRQVVAQVRG